LCLMTLPVSRTRVDVRDQVPKRVSGHSAEKWSAFPVHKIAAIQSKWKRENLNRMLPSQQLLSLEIAIFVIP
jgi:hypothetical protein